MSKFKWDTFHNDEMSVLVANTKLFTKEQAIELAKQELVGFYNEKDIKEYIAYKSYISYGWYETPFTDKINGWHSKDFDQRERKTSFEVEVWLVRVAH